MTFTEEQIDQILSDESGSGSPNERMDTLCKVIVFLLSEHRKVRGSNPEIHVTAAPPQIKVEAAAPQIRVDASPNNTPWRCSVSERDRDGRIKVLHFEPIGPSSTKRTS